LRKLLGNVLLKQKSFENFEVDHEKMLLNGHILEHDTEKLILLAIEEKKD